MTWWQAIILSVVQGLTEFLPVSSSGHLFLLGKFFNIGGDLLLYNVVLHFASLLAVIVVLREDIKKIIVKPKMLLLIFVASLPAVFAGFLIKDYFDIIGGSYLWISGGLLVTSLFVYLVDKIEGDENYYVMSVFQSLKIGLMQMLALVPGVSRSGSTILGGRLVGLKKEAAVRFAFIMSLPVIAGATLLEMWDIYSSRDMSDHDYIKILVGFLVCLVVSYIVVRWFVTAIVKIKFKYFSWYTFFLGLSVLVYYFSTI